MAKKDGMSKSKKGRQSLHRAAKNGGRNLKGLRVRNGSMNADQRLTKSLNEAILTMPEVVSDSRFVPQSSSPLAVAFSKALAEASGAKSERGMTEAMSSYMQDIKEPSGKIHRRRSERRSK